MTGNRHTRSLAIATALCAGFAGGVSHGASMLILPALLLVSAIAQTWWPRASTWLMLAFVTPLTILLVPLSILVVGEGVRTLRAYDDLNRVLLLLLWLVTGVLVGLCATAILRDGVRILRSRKAAPSD
jgi:hypothetical protein